MDVLNYYLFVIIIDFGKATKVIHLAKGLGATGGTILLGRGTIKSNILSILGINESRKEVVLMGIEGDLDEHIHRELEHKLQMYKPNHGIAFSIPLKKAIGINFGEHNFKPDKEGEIEVKYEAIFTIVDKGMSDQVIEAANRAGSTGGTVIHGRGSGTEATAKLFNLKIEPEKDIILILSKSETTQSIVDSIKISIDAEQRGKGIIFVLDVNRVTGLYKGD